MGNEATENVILFDSCNAPFSLHSYKHYRMLSILNKADPRSRGWNILFNVTTHPRDQTLHEIDRFNMYYVWGMLLCPLMIACSASLYSNNPYVWIDVMVIRLNCLSVVVLRVMRLATLQLY